MEGVGGVRDEARKGGRGKGIATVLFPLRRGGATTLRRRKKAAECETFNPPPFSPKPGKKEGGGRGSWKVLRPFLLLVGGKKGGILKGKGGERGEKSAIFFFSNSLLREKGREGMPSSSEGGSS